MIASYALPIVLLPCLAIRVGNALDSETILPVALLFLCWLLVQAYWTLRPGSAALVGYSQTKRTGHKCAAGHEAVCLVHTRDNSNCLCFAGDHWGSSSHPEGFWCCWYRYTHFHFSRFAHSYFVLELVASSDLHSDSAVRHCCQPVCYQLPHYCKMILCLRAACHCIMAQQICAITTSLIVIFLHGSRLLAKPA